MRKIGNILTNSKIINEDWCNITGNQSELLRNVPTLIVGFELAKSLYPNLDVLTWKIDENTFWTFGNREQRHVYEKRLGEFRDLCLKTQQRNVTYLFFNVLTTTKDEKRSFFDKIKESESCTCFFGNDMVFLNLNNSEKVFGLSLRDIEYSGIDKTKFISAISGLKNAKVYTTKYNFPYPVRQFLLKTTYIAPKLCE